VDVWDGITAMADVIATKAYQSHLERTARVT